MPDEALVRGRKYSLLRREALLPNGLQVTVDVVQHPGAAAILPVRHDRGVLLIRQYRVAILDWIWEIPAGTLRPGEAPSECARRELREEAGYEAGRLEKLGEFLPVPDFSDDLIHLFLATDLVPTEQQLDPDEVIEAAWVPLETAMEMVISGDIRDAKTIVALLTMTKRLATE